MIAQKLLALEMDVKCVVVVVVVVYLQSFYLNKLWNNIEDKPDVDKEINELKKELANKNDYINLLTQENEAFRELTKENCITINGKILNEINNIIVIFLLVYILLL